MIIKKKLFKNVSFSWKVQFAIHIHCKIETVKKKKSSQKLVFEGDFKIEEVTWSNIQIWFILQKKYSNVFFFIAVKNYVLFVH